MLFLNPKTGEPSSSKSRDETLSTLEELHPYPNLDLVFALRNMMDIATLVLNLLVLTVLYLEKLREYRCTFYGIMSIYMGIMVVTSACSMMYCISAELFTEVRHNKTLAIISIVVDYFTSFYTVCLIFLMSSNRCFILVYPRLYEKLFTKRNLILYFVIAAIVVASLTVGVALASGTIREYDAVSGALTDYTANAAFVSMVNNIIYIIPILTAGFFLRIYYHLKQIRQDAFLGKTKLMVDKAEVNNCHQAVAVVGTYTACFIIHYVLTFIEPGELQQFLEITESAISCLPGVLMPLSIIGCNSQMRTSIKKYICCMYSKTRVGSATSLTTKQNSIKLFFSSRDSG